MSIFVFVSVKLNSECGNPPLAFPRGETLLANGSSLALSITTRGLSGFQIHLPETPKVLSSQEAGDGAAVDSWSPSYFSLDVGLVEMTKPGSPPQELLHVWFVAFFSPIGKNQTASHSDPIAHWPDSSETPTGLCRVFFVFVFWILVLFFFFFFLNPSWPFS